MDLAAIDALIGHFENPAILSSTSDVFEHLSLLRAFLMDPPQEYVEEGEFKNLQLMASKAGSVILSFDLDKIDESMVHELHNELESLLKPMRPYTFILQMGYFDKFEEQLQLYLPGTCQLGFLDHLVENLQELVKTKPGPIGPSRFYISKFGWNLRAVSSSFKEIAEPRKEEADLKDLIQRITYLAYKVEYAIDSFLVGSHKLRYYMFWLSHIVNEFRGYEIQVKMDSGDIRSILSRVIDRVYPEELEIIPIVHSNEISEKIDESINERRISVEFPVRSWSLFSSYKERKIEVLRELLVNVTFSPDLVDTSGLVTSDMSEDKLEESVHNFFKDRRYFILLKDVEDIDAVNDIRRVLPENSNRSRVLLTTRSPELAIQCRHGSENTVNEISGERTSTSQTKKATSEGEVVGFKEETERMLERLIGGEPKKLHIISIFGMAGQGKTTLAKKLYNDPSVRNYFYTRAWACVSQVYLKRDLLLELLSQVRQLPDKTYLKNDEELAAMLCQSLSGQRFLVVLDDMWSTGAWNDLNRCFRDQNNGSRIIFTTRQKGLASEAQSHSMLQSLNPLSDDESWALLQKKLFQKERCPDELLEVGTDIAKYCKGLPLSVVLTAGLLAKMEKRKDVWKEIAENLSSRILNDAKAEDKGVIELSYKHLPNPLKPCFLYFGAFLEDREVPAQKLIRLWIAEGFIRHSVTKSLEDVAADYLMDLIGRSLVTVAQKKSIRGVKSCRVHDLLREFALTQAREENFLQTIQGYDEHFPSANDNLDYGLDPKFSCPSEPVTYYQRRLCIYSKRNHFFMLKPFGPLVRSLLFVAASDMCPSYSYDLSFMFDNFKLLRILNFEDINIGNSFKEIDVVLHLRYLAVQGTMVSVPSSIANLLNLETLCVKSLEDKVVEVPDSIWNIEKLRHLHINGNASFVMEPQKLESSSMIDNLQSLSTPSLAYGDHMEKILRKLSGLRKLKCIFLDSWDDATNCNQFPVLEFLKKLISLKVFYNGERRYPCQFNFPTNLTKLTLTNFRMPCSEISQLASLDNLKVLKLLGNAFEGEKWEMEDEVVFPKLKFLKLDTLNVVEWIATGDNFPVLEHLILHKCEQLEEIPPGIGDIPTLLMVEVKWCSRSAANSTREIQEMQLDVGNDELIINVHPKIWDSELST